MENLKIALVILGLLALVISVSHCRNNAENTTLKPEIIVEPLKKPETIEEVLIDLMSDEKIEYSMIIGWTDIGAKEYVVYHNNSNGDYYTTHTKDTSFMLKEGSCMKVAAVFENGLEGYLSEEFCYRD